MKREFGLDSSVGIAPNKLLAKLASGRAKPNGVCTVLSGAEVAALLKALPAARMPGCGGKIGDTFAGAGVGSIADLQVLTNCLLLAMLPTQPTQHTILTNGVQVHLCQASILTDHEVSSGTRKRRSYASALQAWSEADMQSALGFPQDLAARLHGWARGRDEAAVAPRPPPKTLSVQMSLTPEPLPMHPSTVGQQAVAGSSRGERCRVDHRLTLRFTCS